MNGSAANLDDIIDAITAGRAVHVRNLATDDGSLAVAVDSPLTVNHGSGDFGDAILGLCAVTGLRRLHPSRRLMYRVRATHLPYLELFDLGDTVYGPHDWDGTRGM